MLLKEFLEPPGGCAYVWLGGAGASVWPASQAGLASGFVLVGMNSDPQGGGECRCRRGNPHLSEVELGCLEIQKFDEGVEIPVGEQ